MAREDNVCSSVNLEHDNVLIQKIAREHRAYDSRLNQLSDRDYLTETERQEMRVLKKKKLLCKDRIAAIKRRAGEKR